MHIRISCLLSGLCLLSALPAAAVAAPGEPTGDPWRDMDYGPFLSAAVEVLPGDIVPKGLAIRLGPEGRDSVLFDINLLRCAAGWSGEFLELRGIVFDGAHGTFPRLPHEPLWRTEAAPGWATNPGLEDPRDSPYAPLPRDLARWRGLYLCGHRVVLSYRIGDTGILELPDVEGSADARLFSRTFNLSPHPEPLYLQVAVDPEASVRVLDPGTLEPASERSSALDTVAVLQRRGSAEENTERGVLAALRGADLRARWIVTGHGQLRLELDPSAEPRHLKLLVGAAATRRALRRLVQVARRSPPAADLEPLTRGGPRRWGEALTTRGEVDTLGVTEELAFPLERGPVTLVDDSRREVSILSRDTLEKAPPGAPSDGTIAVLSEPADNAAEVEARIRKHDDLLIGYWEFEEGAGARSTNLRGTAGPVRLEEARWRRGVEGRALEFEGTGSARITQSHEIDFRRSDLTISVWVNTASDGSLLSKAMPTGQWVPGGKALFIRDGRLGFDIGWVGFVGSDTTVTDSRWHHVAMTWEHGTSRVRLWVDGRRSGEGVLRLEKNGESDGHVVRLGYTSSDFPEGATRFNGKLDRLRIYRKALPEEAIRDLARGAGSRPVTAWAILGYGAGARWVVPRRGLLQVECDGQEKVRRLRAARWDGGADHLESFVRQIRGEEGVSGRPYAIDIITAPESNPWGSWMRFGGFDFFEDASRVAICTWSGDVWVVSGVEGNLDGLQWRRFATGLHQPLGLRIVNDRVHVVGRNQITRLHDLDGDGEADFYESFHNAIENSEHFHEPCMELQTDPEGSFYTMKGARHALEALHRHHGTLIRIPPDGGDPEVVAYGFRASNGLCLGPDGEMYGSDQEGHWMPANRVNRIEPGGFHGNAWGWLPEGRLSTFVPPLCWLHPSVDRSPSSFVWVTSGSWGPVQDHLVSLSYGRGQLFLVLQETVDGATQGAVTPFPLEFPTGIMRARFHPESGHLYTCGLVGWSSDRSRPGGFFRVRWTGAPLHMPVAVHFVRGGIHLRFSDALDPGSAADPEGYRVQVWNYRWSERYGSPDFDLDGEEGRTTLPVASASPAKDAREVFLEIPGLRPVMQVHVDLRLRAADGTPVRTFIHGTIHRLGDRSRAGGTP